MKTCSMKYFGVVCFAWLCASIEEKNVTQPR